MVSKQKQKTYYYHFVSERKSRNAGVTISWFPRIHALSDASTGSQAELMTVTRLCVTRTRTCSSNVIAGIKVLAGIFVR